MDNLQITNDDDDINKNASIALIIRYMRIFSII